MIISAKPLLLSLIAYLIFTSTAHAPSHINMCSSSPDSVPALPWKTRLGLFLASAATDAACRPDGTINRRLLSLLDFRSTPTPNPTNSVKSSDITVDPTRNLWFRVFTPITDDTSLPLLIFFHGGGFAFLSASSKVYDAVCRRFARELPAVVISVNYRLTPEHRFPSQFDDGFDVLKFLDRDHDGMVLPQIADASKIFLIGDSAGANLAHQVALRACREEFRVVKVVGLISIQPFFGGEERIESELRLQSTPLVSLDRTDWLWKVFLPEGANRDHEAVNVSGPNAVDISGMEYPATLVFVGGFDPLQDWQRRYYYWLKKSGKEARLVEYPTMIHAFYVSPELPESSQLIAQVKEFMLSKI